MVEEPIEEKIITDIENNIMEYDESELSDIIIQALLLRRRQEAIDLMSRYLCITRSFRTIKYENLSELWMYNPDIGIYEQHGVTFIDAFVERLCKAGYSKHITNAVIDRIKARTYIREEDFAETDINLICVKNGILNLDTLELKPFSPNHYFFNHINAKFDPSCCCDEFMKFLLSVVRVSDARIIAETFGYCLRRKYDIHRAFMLYAPGRNGKGTLLRVLSAFLGQGNVCSVTLQDLCEKNFARGDLKNKLANVCGDIGTGVITHSEVLKMLVGEDMIDADRKNASRIRFMNFAKILASANKIPKCTDITEGWFSKWIVIEFFYVKYVEGKVYDELNEDQKKEYCVADLKLTDKLTTEHELSGILNLAIMGLRNIIKNGGFTFSQTTEQIRSFMLKKSDSYKSFVDECIEESLDHDEPKTDIRDLYVKYCKYNGIAAESNDKQLRNAILEQFDIIDTKVHIDDRPETRTHCFRGIKLNPLNVYSKVKDDKFNIVVDKTPLFNKDVLPNITYTSSGTNSDVSRQSNQSMVFDLIYSNTNLAQYEKQWTGWTRWTQDFTDNDFKNAKIMKNDILKSDNSKNKKTPDEVVTVLEKNTETENDTTTEEQTPQEIEVTHINLSDDFLSNLELYFSDSSGDLPNDLEHEVYDGALTPATATPMEDEQDQEDDIPQTYAEFLKRLPLVIMNARVLNGTDYAPLTADIVPWLAQNMRTTEAQIEEWLEKALHDGEAYTPHAGRIAVL